MAKIKELYKRALSIKTVILEDLKGGAVLNTSLPNMPILALDIMTITLLELLNITQQEVCAKKTTC